MSHVNNETLSENTGCPKNPENFCNNVLLEFECLSITHVKISHLVTSLPTGRQQDIFALLVTSCQQVWNNLLTTCNNLVEIIRLSCFARHSGLNK